MKDITISWDDPIFETHGETYWKGVLDVDARKLIEGELLFLTDSEWNTLLQTGSLAKDSYRVWITSV